MQVAIVGLPSSGKTTLFNLLTDAGPGPGNGVADAGGGRKADVSVRMARVPDGRVSYLAGVFKPRKTTYAQVEVADVPGITPSGDASETTRFLTYLRTVDAFVYVVRTFEDAPGALPVEYKIDPLGEVELLNLDLILADLKVVEGRLERLESSRRRSADEDEELELLRAIRPSLADGVRLDRLDLSTEQQAKLKGYALLTLKPVVVVPNISEDDFATRAYPGRRDLEEFSRESGVPIVELSAKIELEICGLPERERKEFLDGYGIQEPAVAQLSRELYEVLGLVSFFTVGEDEVRAWPIKRGTTARKAAGEIHSDIERGFIRAEVISFDDFKASDGSVAAARAKGLYRLEGRDYVVKDGDIINFRFNA
ncbi:MAG: redox-regulated ATPase YchF [Bacillota bacterium]